MCKPFDSKALFAVLAKWLGGQPVASIGVEEAPAPVSVAVDFDRGLQLCLGRKALYEEVIDRFLKGLAGEAGKLQAAVAANEVLRIKQIAHSMVSSASVLGAAPLFAAARELEQGAGAADQEKLSRLAQAFLTCHADVVVALRTHVAAREAPGSSD